MMVASGHLGAIKFLLGSDGKIAVSQGWNPRQLTKAMRQQIAEELRDIADNMMADKFEDDGGLKRYPPKKATAMILPYTLRCSELQDQRVRKALLAYRQGRIADAERLLDEVCHMWHYANAAPSWPYAYALVSLLRMVTTRWLTATLHGDRQLPVLLPGEDYDPETATPLPFLGTSDP